MDWERRCIRLCGAMVASAILLRLWSGGVFAPVGRAMAHPRTVSFLLYLHTGRVVRPSRTLRSRRCPSRSKGQSRYLRMMIWPW